MGSIKDAEAFLAHVMAKPVAKSGTSAGSQFVSKKSKMVSKPSKLAKTAKKLKIGPALLKKPVA